MAQEDLDLAEVLTGSLLSMADTRAAIAEANGFSLSVQNFKKAVRFVARAGIGQDVVKRAWAMTVLFVGDVDHGELLPLQRAIELRMQALASLRDEPAFKAWSIKTSADGPAAIEEVLAEVAAIEPIIERDGRPAFEPESFFQAVLARGAVQGQG